MQGLHLTADLYGCACDPSLLTDESALARLCRAAIADVGLTLVADRLFTFPHWKGQPGGVTGALLLAESHLALHTWPELAAVTLDVYVCNRDADNGAAAEALLAALEAAFAPAHSERRRLVRGDVTALRPS